MVELVPPEIKPRVVADFAAGQGSLLNVAQERWPSATIVANEIDEAVSRKLRRQSPKWIIGSADFICKKSSHSAKFNDFLGDVDVVLLNPPFTNLPKSLSSFDYEKCGTATAFVARSLEFLSTQGVLVAVLPDGALSAERNRSIWSEIQGNYTVEHVQRNRRNDFEGVSPETSIIRITKRIRKKNEFQLADKSIVLLDGGAAPLIRGTCQMHTAVHRKDERGHPLIHTSNLQNGKIVFKDSFRVQYTKTVFGPAVLFPRVGRVTTQKICVLRQHRQVVLSDCVLAIECKDTSQAEQLSASILNSWAPFMAAYRGTGAPFISMERARAFLREHIDFSL
ncbi:MAG: methyltransferase [Rhodocyclaceae bacterium]|nr:methyltransferase [Rhodocyclaceae bacterium]